MTLLRTVNLKKYFGETRAVDGINFTVAKGEFLSLVGSNGAGKTSLVNLISAYLVPDEGQIILDEVDITYSSVNDRVRAGISRTFDNVALAIFSRQEKTRNPMALADHDTEVMEEALSLLRQFGLHRTRTVQARGLSQGERKLLDVAVAYALRPKLLFLDEPTSGVSTRDKNQIMDTISNVVRGGNVTAVVIEHDMDVVFKYSDRIVAMHEGKIFADGTPEEIRRNKEVATTLIGAAFTD